MPFVNRRDGREVETVDSCETMAEALRLAREYRIADSSASYYASTRATADYMAEVSEAAKPEAIAPARPVPAYLDSHAGLVPCLVMGATTRGGGLRFDVRFTGRRATLPEQYRAGQSGTQHAFRIVPRDAIRGRRAMSGPRIVPFEWADVWPELAAMRGT